MTKDQYLNLNNTQYKALSKTQKRRYRKYKTEENRNGNTDITNSMSGQYGAIWNMTRSLASGLSGINIARGAYPGQNALSATQEMEASVSREILTFDRYLLSELYRTSSLFQVGIDGPVFDAFSKGIEIESEVLSSEDIEDLYKHMEDLDVYGTLIQWIIWTRLWGRADLIINTGDSPDKPLTLNSLYKKPMEFYTMSWWELEPGNIVDGSYLGNRYGRLADEHTITREYSYHGQRIDPSRVMIADNKMAPWPTNLILRGRGMSQAETYIRDLNLFLKTQNTLFSLLDETKIDIFKLDKFKQDLLSNKADAIERRIKFMNMVKSTDNALIIDKLDEFETKHNSSAITGNAAIMEQNMIGIAGAFRRPIVKVFGISPSAWSNTDIDMLNYHESVESEVRMPYKRIVKKLLNIVMLNRWGKTYPITINYPSLSKKDEESEERVKKSQTERLLLLAEAGYMTPRELGQEAQALELLNTPLSVIDTDTVIPTGKDYNEMEE